MKPINQVMDGKTKSDMKIWLNEMAREVEAAMSAEQKQKLNADKVDRELTNKIRKKAQGIHNIKHNKNVRKKLACVRRDLTDKCRQREYFWKQARADNRINLREQARSLAQAAQLTEAVL